MIGLYWLELGLGYWEEWIRFFYIRGFGSDFGDRLEIVCPRMLLHKWRMLLKIKKDFLENGVLNSCVYFEPFWNLGILKIIEFMAKRGFLTELIFYL